MVLIFLSCLYSWALSFNIAAEKSFDVTCDVTDLSEVETIRTFFNDHPDLLPSSICEKVFTIS